MRGFYSGRKFSCHEIVLVLFLSAAVSLNAQSGSAPQSQPGQSSSAPQTQSQSQTPDTPACASGRPILKRGPQPALPPCPDPPPDASPSAGSGPTRSLSPTAPLIERAREAAFEFSQKLPNFICEEFMSRNTERGREGDSPLDVVSAQVIYEDGKESYQNVKVDGRATAKGMEELGGAWSTGEFASTLLEIFHPATDAQFHPGGTSSLSGVAANAQVYDFQVRAENSHWKVQAGEQTVVPAYQGSLWVDPSTARVLRIELEARNLPSDFPMDTVESAVDYANVTIGAQSFLLPTHAESLGCQRGTNACSHNVIDFRNYHEFKTEIKIGN